jgi:hypothetical protein
MLVSDTNGIGQIPGINVTPRMTQLFGFGQAPGLDPSEPIETPTVTLPTALVGIVVAVLTGIAFGAAVGVGTSISPIRTKVSKKR